MTHVVVRRHFEKQIGLQYFVVVYDYGVAYLQALRQSVGVVLFLELFGRIAVKLDADPGNLDLCFAAACRRFSRNEIKERFQLVSAQIHRSDRVFEREDFVEFFKSYLSCRNVCSDSHRVRDAELGFRKFVVHHRVGNYVSERAVAVCGIVSDYRRSRVSDLFLKILRVVETLNVGLKHVREIAVFSDFFGDRYRFVFVPYDTLILHRDLKFADNFEVYAAVDHDDVSSVGPLKDFRRIEDDMVVAA